MQRGGAGEEAGDPRHLWSASQTARYKDKSPPIAGGGQVDSMPPRPCSPGLWGKPSAGQQDRVVACYKKG